MRKKPNKLIVKYASNRFAAASVDLPGDEPAIIAIPAGGGMDLMCNSRATAKNLCKYFDVVGNKRIGGRPVIRVALVTGKDGGVAALNAHLKQAGYNIEVQSDIPWLVGR